MKNEIISMTALPYLSEEIKLAIGFSIWNLYHIHCSEHEEIRFLLETTDNSYLLHENGKAVKPLEEENIEKISKVLIEGYVIPTNIKLNSL